MDPQKDIDNVNESSLEFEEYLTGDVKSNPSQGGLYKQYVRSRIGFRLFLKRLIDKYFINRLHSLFSISRFVLIWLIFIGICGAGLLLQIRQLDSYHTVIQAQAGGTYIEGMVGRVTNLNPIYANTKIDQSVTSLVFDPLFSYDNNNQLIPVLAESINADESARQFTLVLKPDLKWHDGQPITIDDVIFTIETIKDYRSQSPLRSNWLDVEMDKLNQHSLVFTLPASFSPFIANLDLRIIPKHILANIEPAKLRNADFNYQPVGSGKFEFSQIVRLNSSNINAQEVRIELVKNEARSLAFNQPILIDQLHIWVVPSSQRLADLFNQSLISGTLDLDQKDIKLSSYDYTTTDLRTMTGVYLFYKTSTSFMQEVKARKALTYALNTSELLSSLNYVPEKILSPLLPQHLGYNASINIPQYNLDKASSLLKELGYYKQNSSWYYKDGNKISLKLTVAQDTEYELIAINIKEQLEDFGIEVVIDLRLVENIAFDILNNHQHGDMMIHGINLGRDSDVYSYWHSSQFGRQSIFRLNLSQYVSQPADQALEAGRSRADVDIRAKRYMEFQDIWAEDLPAIPLYRLSLKYYHLNTVRGAGNKLLLLNTHDRFADIHNWATIFKQISMNNKGKSDLSTE